MKSTTSYINYDNSVTCRILFCLLMPKPSWFFPFLWYHIVHYCLGRQTQVDFGHRCFVCLPSTLDITLVHFVRVAYLRLSSVVPTTMQLPLEFERRSSDSARDQAHSS